MHQVIQTIKQQLADGSTHGMDSLLEVLYEQYMDTTPEGHDKVKAGFREMEDCVSALPFAQQDQICCTAAALCAECERVAFLDGVRIGARMIFELLNM